VSTWRGLVAAWRMGLARSIGVSNFNSTMIQDLVDAALPLPAVNQIDAAGVSKGRREVQSVPAR
jgi:aldehyde reductase